MSLVNWLWIIFAIAFALGGVILLVRALFADRSRSRKRCPKCWYDMSGAPSAASVDGDGSVAPLRCPECGREIKHARQLARTRRRWRWAFAAALLLLAATGCFITGKAKRDGWESVTPTTALILIAEWSDDPWALQSLWNRSTEPYEGFVSFRVLQDGALWDWQWRWLAHTCLDLLDSHKPQAVREMAMNFLQAFDLSFNPGVHSRALELWPALVNDANPVIQRDAVLKSGVLLPIEQSIAVAAEHARSTDRRIQSAAIVALDFIDKRGGRVRDLLFDLLETGSVEQRRGAAAALGRLQSADPNSQRTIDVLLRHAKFDADSSVRGWCLQWLARSEAPRDVVEALLAQALSNSDPKARDFALQAEMFAFDKSLLKVEHLFQCLNDEDQTVRGTAVWVLMDIDAERLRDHVPALQRLLDHADEGIAQAAEQKLNALGVAPAADKPAR